MPEFDQAFLQQAENDVKNLYNLYTNDRQDTLRKVSIDEIATTVRERPFNLKGGYGFFLKKYSDSQCC
jgi:hypothetical protein